MPREKHLVKTKKAAPQMLASRDLYKSASDPVSLFYKGAAAGGTSSLDVSMRRLLKNTTVAKLPSLVTLEKLEKITTSINTFAGQYMKTTTAMRPVSLSGADTIVKSAASLGVSMRKYMTLVNDMMPRSLETMKTAVDASTRLQRSLSENLNKFATNSAIRTDFILRQSSILEALQSVITEYSIHEDPRNEAKPEIRDRYEVPTVSAGALLDARLQEINPNWLILLQGARQALIADNPDRARHVSVSLRTLMEDFRRQLAPDENIKAWNTNPTYYHKDRPTKRARLLYISREVSCGRLTEVIEKEVDSVLTFINILDSETHVAPSRLTDRQLQVLVSRAESFLWFWCTLNGLNA